MLTIFYMLSNSLCGFIQPKIIYSIIFLIGFKLHVVP